MKARILVLLLIVGIGFLNSCNNDDDDSSQEKSINGTWYLTNIRGGLGSMNNDYSIGDVKWTFDQTNSILIVENKIGNSNSFYLHSGTYSFNIVENEETQIFFIDNNN
ncbi:hypothetical protein [Gelidibacter salicanalis]|uniref:Lipocalin-like domain-containing protein n=1 Tax=Gelidibacter salicanalis TaxID=291193 RepID=A0A934NI26_9FLAO|nr:hypothetical protein [Gelidibacter salicanalis]MBJ7879599.1 hypothetical protein [Gelidibacter salicanalis]